jgi:hypothetical protein
MSSWPFQYDYHNPLPPLPFTEEYMNMDLYTLWELFIHYLETFIYHHIFITTTHHSLSLTYHILNGTLRNRGDLSFRDAATISWIHKHGAFNGQEWADKLNRWHEAIYDEQRHYERVLLIS